MSIATADQPADRPRQRVTLKSVLAEYGVRIVPVHKGRKAYETQAGQTLKKLFADHGAGHMRAVLSCIVEPSCERNARALTAPVIKAVSSLLLAHPQWYERDATTWLSVFDRTDLIALHERVKRNRQAAEPKDSSAAMLFEELDAAFAETSVHTLERGRD
ncbi:MAG: hypothetical protein ROR55_21260 [Devosia sp.]